MQKCLCYIFLLCT